MAVTMVVTMAVTIRSVRSFNVGRSTHEARRVFLLVCMSYSELWQAQSTKRNLLPYIVVIVVAFRRVTDLARPTALPKVRTNVEVAVSVCCC